MVVRVMADGDGSTANTEAPPLVAAYRHDVHKLRGRRHAAAADTVAGVSVNEAVPFGADRDAALLSRPRGDPEPTMDVHTSPDRLSLVSGAVADDRHRGPASRDEIAPLVQPSDPETLHARWLTGTVPARFTEAVYYPYTSLQYHTLLVAALLANYRAGHAFADLYMAVSGDDAEAALNGDAAVWDKPQAALAADVVEPHRTVLWTPGLAIHVTAEPGDRPAARLGPRPARSFADVWSRLPANPLPVDGDDAWARRWRLLDAQLRRLRSWSTALQYIADYTTTYIEGDQHPRSQPRSTSSPNAPTGGSADDG
jgi:hypothetical protein